MNGIFNTGITFWQAIAGIFAIAFSIIAVKIAISFDVNKYLERKDKKLIQKIKNNCMHLEMEQVGNSDFKVKSLFESPPGTHQWQCQRCGLVKNHDTDFERRAEYYSKNPDEFIKQNKKFEKLLKKSGQA